MSKPLYGFGYRLSLYYTLIIVHIVSRIRPFLRIMIWMPFYSKEPNLAVNKQPILEP